MRAVSGSPAVRFSIPTFPIPMTVKTFFIASLMTVSLVACSKKDDAAGTSMDSTATGANVDSAANTTPMIVNDTNKTAVDANANPTVTPNSTDTAVMQDAAKNDSLLNAAGDTTKK